MCTIFYVVRLMVALVRTSTLTGEEVHRTDESDESPSPVLSVKQRKTNYTLEYYICFSDSFETFLNVL